MGMKEAVGGEGGGGEEGEGEISPMCESIGHRPLWGRCPKKRKKKEKKKKDKKEKKRRKKVMDPT